MSFERASEDEIISLYCVLCSLNKYNYSLPTLTRALGYGNFPASQNNAPEHANSMWPDLSFPYNSILTYQDNAWGMWPGVNVPVFVIRDWDIHREERLTGVFTEIGDQVNPFVMTGAHGMKVARVRLTGQVTPVQDAHCGELAKWLAAQKIGLRPAGDPAYGFYSHATRERWAASEVQTGWPVQDMRSGIITSALVLYPAKHMPVPTNSDLHLTFAFGSDQGWYFCTRRPSISSRVIWADMLENSAWLEVKARGLCKDYRACALTVAIRGVGTLPQDAQVPDTDILPNDDAAEDSLDLVDAE